MLAIAPLAFPSMTDAYVNSIFGVRMNGIRYRAQILVTGGHIDSVSCRVAEGKLRGTTRKCFIFNCVCSASVTAKAYNVTVVFDDGQRYSADASSCKCPDGNLFCSHMLGALCMIKIFQLAQVKGLTFTELLDILPESVNAIQNIPCPWKWLLQADNYKYADRETADNNETQNG
jgi:hypothetical protein